MQFLSTLSLRRATRAENHANSQQEFLSTLSLRRATDGLIASANFCKFLSTLSLRRATRADRLTHAPPKISIHALLAESDAGKHAQQPTRPISIHALLAESDCGRSAGLPVAGHFYPRSPCGERPASGFFIGSRSQFLSTLSLRRATL